MEWPKRVRTADWENGIFILDGDKRLEVSELTTEIIERLAKYSLVGFHVKGYPVTDDMLAPFIGHKSMVNFGVEDGKLTDACLSTLATMPKLRYLILDGNLDINGSGLDAFRENKIDLLCLNRTGQNDAGLLQASLNPKLSHIQLDDTEVTYEGLLRAAVNRKLKPVAHKQFTQEQLDNFAKLQRDLAKKLMVINEDAAAECRKVLSAFFAEMTEWEEYMDKVGFDDTEAVPRLMAIWDKYVCEKPRLGYRPLGLSYTSSGTYSRDKFIDAEQVTRNKLYIYTKEENTGFERRFLMKHVDGGWKIDAVQERLDGWQRVGL